MNVEESGNGLLLLFMVPWWCVLLSSQLLGVNVICCIPLRTKLLGLIVKKKRSCIAFDEALLASCFSFRPLLCTVQLNGAPCFSLLSLPCDAMITPQRVKDPLSR